ncbi:DUF397 domain-containing protein [Actinoallomurus sp. CA-150999]
MDRPRLTDPEWRKSSRSGEPESSCVEVAVAWLAEEQAACTL